MMRLGVIGLGYIARSHLAAARELPDVEIVAATRSRSAAPVLAKYPELRIDDRPEDVLDDPEIGGVIICVPTFLHETYVTMAARAGKHILCEKPFALDDAAAERMLDAVRRAGVTLMIGQVLRFWPEYVRLRALVQAGLVGDVRAVTAWRLAEYPAWGSWFRDPEKSGGCLLDLQIHDIDFLHWLLGAPESVYAHGVKSETGSWDHVVTTLGYADAVAQVEASYLMPLGWPFRMGLRVTGSGGAVEYGWRVAGNIEERSAAQQGLFLHVPGAERTAVPVDPADPYAEQLRYFAGQISRGEEPTICPPEESLAVMRVMAACRTSVESGAAVAMAGR